MDDELIALASGLRERCDKAIDGYQFSTALAEIWKVVARSNKYIDETARGCSARTRGKRARLAAVLYNLCESLRIVSVLLTPFMPETAPRIQKQLGLSGDSVTYETAARGA